MQGNCCQEGQLRIVADDLPRRAANWALRGQEIKRPLLSLQEHPRIACSQCTLSKRCGKSGAVLHRLQEVVLVSSKVSR